LPVFRAQGGQRGLIVVEVRRGTNNAAIGTFFPVTQLTHSPPPDRPSLQIQASAELGDGSMVVCDTGPPPPAGEGGGIPPVFPPSFAEGDQTITNALNDFACRFEEQPPAINSENACTLNAVGNFSFLGTGTQLQFCDDVSQVAAFAVGDTVLTARVLDVNGTPGPSTQIVVRVLLPSP